MRKTSILLFTFLVSILILLACSKEDNEIEKVQVASISIDIKSLSLIEGETGEIQATILPENAKDKTLTWKSSDTSIATVDNGKVLAVKEGKARISVTTSNNITQECEVNVSTKIIKIVEAVSVSLDNKTLSTIEGKTAQLVASILPEDTTNKKCNWFSDNEEIATIDADGLITALKEGKANITVSTSNNKTAICNITVTPKPVYVKSVNFDKSEYKIALASTSKINVTILPANATNKTITWKSSDANIVSIKDGGILSAEKVGQATLTVTSEDGNKTATCTVIVEEGNDDDLCKDADGRVYKTVEIGNQVWMAENLAYLTADMLTQKTAFVYDYAGEDLSAAKALDNYTTYGVLYTFAEAEKCIPAGWHLPTDAEFKELEMHIGNSQDVVDGGGTRGDFSAKLMSDQHWSDSKFELSNETGFSALPAGYRSSTGTFSKITKRTVFWGARYETDKSKGRALFNDRQSINRSDANFASGYSIRCIKD
jgi:uncharacterized protein (TIGR02145 family)